MYLTTDGQQRSTPRNTVETPCRLEDEGRRTPSPPWFRNVVPETESRTRFATQFSGKITPESSPRPETLDSVRPQRRVLLNTTEDGGPKSYLRVFVSAIEDTGPSRTRLSRHGTSPSSTTPPPEPLWSRRCIGSGRRSLKGRTLSLRGLRAQTVLPCPTKSKQNPGYCLRTVTSVYQTPSFTSSLKRGTPLHDTTYL